MVAAGDERISELKHAYVVLDVPLTASALSIKQAYRKLVKRWHPDLYASGKPEHAEATRMTQAANDAYAAIQDAPLRYYAGNSAGRATGATASVPAGVPRPTGARTQEPPKVDRLEFWVRFVCGAIAGVLLGFRALMYSGFYSLTVHRVGLAIVAMMLGCGLAAARFGDDFWRVAFSRWWLWW